MKKTAYTGAKIITADKAHELIKKDGNKWFWVAFIRKTDKIGRDNKGNKIIAARAGDVRYMCARTGVTKGRKTKNGEGRKYNHTEKRLSSVWDRKAQGYRAFGWDNLVYLKIGGKKYVVVNETARQFCKNHPNHEMTKAMKDNGVCI